MRRLGKDMSEIVKIMHGLDSVHVEWVEPSNGLPAGGLLKFAFEI